VKNHRLTFFFAGALAVNAAWMSPAVCGERSAPLAGSTSSASTTEESFNNGEDITKPLDRFDVRFQGKTLPDAVEGGRLFDDRNTETVTLRSDCVFFSKPNQFSVRLDLPLVWSNKPTSENKTGLTQFGLGDILLQTAYVRTFDARWAGAIGLQTIFPTATDKAFGDGKWRLIPSVALRAEVPEISAGTYVGVIVRQDLSVAGVSSRNNINDVILQPQINIGLPDQWFLNTSPQLYYNVYTNKWFVPLDIMVGKKFGTSWVASLEYQYGVVHDYDRYRQWLEARVGYFF
jgi:hypothetical protein